VAFRHYSLILVAMRGNSQQQFRAADTVGIEIRSSGSAMERPRWGQLILTFLVLLLFSWLGIALSRQSEGVATIWLTNGMLFAIVITRPRSVWLHFFAVGLLADTLADVLYGDPIALALGVSVANSIEVILSSFVLTYWFGSPFSLSKRRPLLGFLGVSVLGATAITSAIGASWTLLFVDAGPWWKLFRTWYLGDILGMAIIAPLVFILLRPGFFAVLGRKQLADTLVLLSVPAIATALVFTHDSDPLIFFIFPALLLVVFRLGFPGTVLSVCVIAFISISLTVAGHGPMMLIMDKHMLHRIVVVQIFLAVALFTAFPVAALLEERKALEESLQKSEARYRQLANADGLTGLANRRWFDERLEEQWQRGLEEARPVALLLIDVDLFKAYNDLFGHMSGDSCLRRIAGVIAEGLRDSSGMASRFGGEEFAVILPNAGSEEALAVAEGLRSAVAALNLSHSGSPWGVQTISIGVAAMVPNGTESAMSLLNASDNALYCAKRLGRNRVESSLTTALMS
jgi:diguanylate cyclase (GGDEF)-like protein